MTKTNKSFIILGISIIAVLGLAGISSFLDQNNKKEDELVMLNESGNQSANQTAQTIDAQMQDNSQTSETSTPATEDNSQKLIKNGYVNYSENLELDPNSKKVLFFHASWCPSCRTLDQNLKNTDFDNLAKDLVVLKVDYDTENNLKNKYKVTYQHTLVEVDNNWNQIKKFSGSNDLVDINQEIN